MSELIDLLLCASLWLAFALLVLALVRPLLLHLGGPQLVYRSWWLLPVLLLVLAMPQPPVAALAGVPVLALPTLQAVAAAGTPLPAVHWPLLLLALWAAGAAVCALRAGRAQHRFERALGTVRRRADGSWQASGDPGLPALVGLWHPRIVVGPAFDQQFCADEQRLVLLHEQNHLRHGDHWANAALLVLRCVFWFHPLLPWAAARFLRDQELACDARTLAPHPALRRTYATALLKAQLVPSAVPMACHWRGQPLLKERIAMMKQSERKTLPRVAGQVVAAGLCVAVATVAWASQATAGGEVTRTTRITSEMSSTSSSTHGDTDTDTTQQRDVQVENMSPPAFPRAAFDNGQSGKVMLQVDVDAHGNASNVRVVSATLPGVFDEASVAAARSWTYLPALRDGRPVAGSVRIPITFELDETASTL